MAGWVCFKCFGVHSTLEEMEECERKFRESFRGYTIKDIEECLRIVLEYDSRSGDLP